MLTHGDCAAGNKQLNWRDSNPLCRRAAGFSEINFERMSDPFIIQVLSEETLRRFYFLISSSCLLMRSRRSHSFVITHFLCITPDRLIINEMRVGGSLSEILTRSNPWLNACSIHKVTFITTLLSVTLPSCSCIDHCYLSGIPNLTTERFIWWPSLTLHTEDNFSMHYVIYTQFYKQQVGFTSDLTTDFHTVTKH